MARSNCERRVVSMVCLHYDQHTRPRATPPARTPTISTTTSTTSTTSTNSITSRHTTTQRAQPRHQPQQRPRQQLQPRIPFTITPRRNVFLRPSSLFTATTSYMPRLSRSRIITSPALPSASPMTRFGQATSAATSSGSPARSTPWSCLRPLGPLGATSLRL